MQKQSAMKKVVTIVGARPQFIKAAVVSRAISEYNRNTDSQQIKEVIVHTGQHYDNNMSTVFFDEMHIPEPDYRLNIHGLSHGAMTGQMLEKIEALLSEEKPDVVLVYGDTNTTLSGALAATKLHSPVAHVEAGLRSFNRIMPEEINRVLTDHVSNILFCPTQTAIDNLKIEGIGRPEIQSLDNRDKKNRPIVQPFFNLKKSGLFAKQVAVNVGDVMLDATRFHRKFAEKPEFDVPMNFILATIHRAENTDYPERLENILAALTRVSQETAIILPLHPRTKKAIREAGKFISPKTIQIVEPVGYLNMIYLLERCSMVMTDSGGLQKEAFFFHKPCITLRDETEWVELVENGYNIVAGTETDNICEAFFKMTAKRMDYGLPLYGNGCAGEKIVRILMEHV